MEEFIMHSGNLIITNARIWTGCQDQPWTDSIVIHGGRIVHSAVRDQNYVTINAQGRVVTPGLIDSHMHFLLGAESHVRTDLSTVQSREEFEAVIEHAHKHMPECEWLIANGWSEEHWSNNELPTKSWLAPAGNRPVVCYRMDQHAAVVNDAVLKLCDLSQNIPNGRVVRCDRTGEPTGLMVEQAAWKLVNPLIPDIDTEAKRECIRNAQTHLHTLGITAVGTMEYGQTVKNVFESLREELTVRTRVTLLDRDWPLDFTLGRNFKNDDMLTVIGYKAFLDGTLGSRTARMLEDYADDPGNRGLFVELAASDDLRSWFNAVLSEGFSPSMHAIGDHAVRLALDVMDGTPQDVHARIEHAQHIHSDDTPRCANRIISMQPLHKAHDGQSIVKRLGSSRIERSFPFRELVDANAILAFGSDWPVVSCDPVEGIRTAITGSLCDGSVMTPEQNVSVEDSLRAYTTNAAHALKLNNCGTLQPGAFGDLVMFSHDPFESNWIDNPPSIILTVANGRIVHDARTRDTIKPDRVK